MLTAEEFADSIVLRCLSAGQSVYECDKLFKVTPRAVAAIEARDAAVRLAAKRELLNELKTHVCEPGCDVHRAVLYMLAKPEGGGT